MSAAHPNPENTEKPDHQVGGYRSWMLQRSSSARYDMLWVHEATARQPQLIMPHSEPSIGIQRFFNANGDINDVRLIVCSGYGQAEKYSAPPHSELIAVRLKPEFAHRLLSVAPQDYSDHGLILDATALSLRFENACRVAEFASAIEVGVELLRELDRSTIKVPAQYNNCEVVAARILRRTEGRPPVSAIARYLEVSERTLRRRFTNIIGVSPKTFARRLRVTGALLRAERSTKPNWAQIAHEYNYHDQSHLIADFKSQTDMTPAETLAYRRSLSVFSNTPGV